MTVTITPDELAARIDDVVLLDVRWNVMKPDGRDAYLAGHLPGAVFVNLDDELADHTVTGAGRHPLPSAVALQAAARRWGVSTGDTVVVYDDWNNQAAARAWWLLKAAGIDAYLLDGGWGGWQKSGRPTETGDVTPAHGDVVVESLDGMPTATADDVAEQARSGIVLDARAGERFRGEVEPLDKRAGHVPGARSVPTAGNVDDDGVFLSADDLRKRFADSGVAEGEPPIVYCGSGVTATHQIAALAIAGHEAVLYPGSWSEWSSDPNRPVATGP